tara:strand:- start:921 stop:1400 length:480 start_codon:yes stop_codon:yes gene_type:complete
MLDVSVDDFGNNKIVKETLSSPSTKNLLSALSSSGLLSKAKKAGIKLSTLEPLLKEAGKNPDLLILVEAASPELLPFLPKIVSLAPAAIPLLAALVGVPSTALFGVGAGAVGAAGFLVTQGPLGDSFGAEAVQSFLAVVLLVAGGASFVGGKVLGDLTK